MRILLIEDDLNFCETLRFQLEQEAYEVDVCHDGRDGLDLFLQDAHDIVLLDRMLPTMNGLLVLQKARQAGISTPVILITALGELYDRIEGLDAGADDYLPKPFSVSELLARVRAMLRRREQYQAEVLSYGDLSLNSASFELVCQDQKQPLSSREYQIMEMLMRTPTAIVTSDTLMEQVWGWDSEVSVNNIWVYISNLRQKLQQLNTTVSIRAVRGVGYCMEESK